MALEAIVHRSDTASVPRLCGSGLLTAAGAALIALGALWLAGRHRQTPLAKLTAGVALSLGAGALLGASSCCWKRSVPQAAAAVSEPVLEPGTTVQPAQTNPDREEARLLEELTAAVEQVRTNPEADAERLGEDLVLRYGDGRSDLEASLLFIRHVGDNTVWLGHFCQQTSIGMLLSDVLEGLLDFEDTRQWREEEQGYLELLRHEEWANHPGWAPIAWYLVKHVFNRSAEHGLGSEPTGDAEWAQIKVDLLNATRPLWAEYPQFGRAGLWSIFTEWCAEAREYELQRLPQLLTALAQAIQAQAPWALPMFRDSLLRLAEDLGHVRFLGTGPVLNKLFLNNP